MRRAWILWRRSVSHALERARQWLLEFTLLERRVTLLPGCKVTGLQHVVFGEDILISHETFIQGAGGITLGNRIMIGPRVMLISTGHNLVTRNSESRPIEIEDDVWLGAGSIILPGVRVGKGSIVGAGAVVTKNVEPYSVVVRVPSPAIKTTSLSNNEGYFSTTSWRRQFE